MSKVRVRLRILLKGIKRLSMYCVVFRKVMFLKMFLFFFCNIDVLIDIELNVKFSMCVDNISCL